ncbi:MAG: NADPH2:quinone reductase [Candidatus Midichloriaceae bacterium]|jgi:NADPH2:quinone reductase
MTQIPIKRIKINVKAIGVNRADILQLEGKYPAPDNNPIPGLEIAGIRIDTNERVCALLTSGGYSNVVEVDESQIFTIPDGLDFVEAAALPEALVTTWLNLFQLGNIHNISNVLIHGGASGICSMMVKFALFFGKKVYTTSKNIEKLDYLKNIDNCTCLTFDDYIENILNYGKVDLVIDILGGKYLDGNLKVLQEKGRLILFAVMDNKTSEINIARILLKNLTIIGSTLRNKTKEEKALLINDMVKNLLPIITSGKISPIISKIFKLEDYKSAHDFIKSGKNIGKVILEI